VHSTKFYYLWIGEIGYIEIRTCPIVYKYVVTGVQLIFINVKYTFSENVYFTIMNFDQILDEITSFRFSYLNQSVNLI